MKLEPILRNGKWELEGDVGPFGPYETKAEALEDKRGLELFYNKHRYEKPTYVAPPPKPPKPPEPPPKPKRTRKTK